MTTIGTYIELLWSLHHIYIHVYSLNLDEKQFFMLLVVAFTELYTSLECRIEITVKVTVIWVLITYVLILIHPSFFCVFFVVWESMWEKLGWSLEWGCWHSLHGLLLSVPFCEATISCSLPPCEESIKTDTYSTHALKPQWLNNLFVSHRLTERCLKIAQHLTWCVIAH